MQGSKVTIKQTIYSIHVPTPSFITLFKPLELYNTFSSPPPLFLLKPLNPDPVPCHIIFPFLLLSWKPLNYLVLFPCFLFLQLSSLPLPSSNPAIQPVISRVHLSSSSPLSLTSLLISCITLWCYLIDLSDNQTGLQLSLSLPSMPLSLFILGNWLALMNYPAQHVSVYTRPHTEQGVCFRAPGEQIQTLQWVCVCVLGVYMEDCLRWGVRIGDWTTKNCPH